VGSLPLFPRRHVQPDGAEVGVKDRVSTRRATRLAGGQIQMPFDVAVRAADEHDCVPALAAIKAPR